MRRRLLILACLAAGIWLLLAGFWTISLWYGVRCECFRVGASVRDGSICVWWVTDPDGRSQGLRIERIGAMRFGFWQWRRFLLLSNPREDFAVIPLGIPLAVTAPVIALLFRFVRGHPRGHCQKCGYDLAGNTSNCCPGCGTTVSPSGQDPATS